jgi:farnesyl diphosphate synthase
MTFAQSLTRAATLTEDTLDRLLAEKSLSGEAPEPQSGRLIAAMRHAVLGGGKRVRPLLVIESSALFGIPAQSAVHTAAALELVHCYSLAHDDLPAMDNDELRRGRATVWKAYDEWTAILAGDGLLTLAFEILARPETHPDPTVRNALVSALARASGAAGMVGGQALDLMADKLGDPATPTVEYIRRLQAMKTGALLVFACEAGAILGQASDAERRSLLEFGTALGFAFQIADDLLDAEGDVATVGKAVAKDAAANKATLVSLMGIPEAKAMLTKTEARANDALAIFGSKADVLREAARFVVNRKS